MVDSAKKIVMKNEFAEICGVTPGRVSQWISEGKLTGAALVGEGRAAKIDVSVAVGQLKTALNASQRFGLNGLATRLSVQAAAAPAQLPLDPSGDSDQSTRDADADVDEGVRRAIQAEKLRQAQLTTRRAEEQDRLARGIYIRAADAAADATKVAADLLILSEAALNDYAAAVAAKFNVPVRDLKMVLQIEFRSFRARVAAKYLEMAAALPETVEDNEACN